MTKIEITAAMVERAKTVLVDGGLLSHGETVESHARRILSAALNPPPKPEITVTREMSRSGAEAYNAYVAAYRPNLLVSDMAFVGGVSAAYRAMRALEPKPKANIQDDPRWPFHQRASDAPMYWSHRRSSDLESTTASDGTIFTTRGASRLHGRSGDDGDDTYFHRRAGDPK